MCTQWSMAVFIFYKKNQILSSNTSLWSSAKLWQVTFSEHYSEAFDQILDFAYKSLYDLIHSLVSLLSLIHRQFL